jgi:transposase
MAKKYLVNLTEAERTTLLTLTKKGSVAARKLTRAHILLHADDQASDADIAKALHSGTATVERTRKRFGEEGLETALSERPRAGARRKLAGKQDACRVALAGSAPPDERKCWTMPLLADQLVELQQVESMSDETVRRTRKKPSSSRGCSKNGVSPRSAPSAYGAWKRCWTCTPSPMIGHIRSSVLMQVPTR